MRKLAIGLCVVAILLVIAFAIGYVLYCGTGHEVRWIVFLSAGIVAEIGIFVTLCIAYVIGSVIDNCYTKKIKGRQR